MKSFLKINECTNCVCDLEPKCFLLLILLMPVMLTYWIRHHIDGQWVIYVYLWIFLICNWFIFSRIILHWCKACDSNLEMTPLSNGYVLHPSVTSDDDYYALSPASVTFTAVKTTRLPVTFPSRFLSVVGKRGLLIVTRLTVCACVRVHPFTQSPCPQST